MSSCGSGSGELGKPDALSCGGSCSGELGAAAAASSSSRYSGPGEYRGPQDSAFSGANWIKGDIGELPVTKDERLGFTSGVRASALAVCRPGDSSLAEVAGLTACHLGAGDAPSFCGEVGAKAFGSPPGLGEAEGLGVSVSGSAYLDGVCGHSSEALPLLGLFFLFFRFAGAAAAAAC